MTPAELKEALNLVETIGKLREFLTDPLTDHPVELKIVRKYWHRKVQMLYTDEANIPPDIAPKITRLAYDRTLTRLQELDVEITDA